jgi:hypothetical protein
MASTRYVIPDEPLPGAMERWIVDPMWPLFAQMLGGSWLALPWFVFNGVALGSPTRRREWLLAAASLVGSAALLFAVVAAAGAGWLEGTGVRLALLSLVTLKLAIAYVLYMLQARSFELWRHFGGVPANGMLVAVAAIFARRMLFTTLVTAPMVQQVLG